MVASGGGRPSWTHVGDSAAVIGMDEADAIALGARFGQDAIFVLTPVGRRVVGCTDNRIVTTGWATEPDAGTGRRSLPVSRFPTCTSARPILSGPMPDSRSVGAQSSRIRRMRPLPSST